MKEFLAKEKAPAGTGARGIFVARRSKVNADSRASQPASGPQPAREDATWYGQLLGPESLRDPIKGNPFPVLDHRRSIWKEKTLEAESELYRLHAQFQVQIREPQDPQGPAMLMFELCVGTFDVWAKRSCQFISSEKDLQRFDQWISNFTQESFDIFKEAVRNPMRFPINRKPLIPWMKS